MAKRTTAKERREYIQQQRADSVQYGSGQTKRPLGDMSFIDRDGNIVRPTRDNPFPTVKEGTENYDAERGKVTTLRPVSDTAEGAAEEVVRYILGEARKAYRASKRYHGLTAILGLLGGIFFFSSNITGNAIANLTTKTTSFLGAGLLVIGLVAGFFWLKAKK
jgi:hypothetical protein